MRKRLLGFAVAAFGLASVVILRTVRLSHEVPNVGPVDRHVFSTEEAVQRLAQALRTDERIGVENYAEMTQFQIRLLRNMTS